MHLKVLIGIIFLKNKNKIVFRILIYAKNEDEKKKKLWLHLKFGATHLCWLVRVGRNAFINRLRKFHWRSILGFNRGVRIHSRQYNTAKVRTPVFKGCVVSLDVKHLEGGRKFPWSPNLHQEIFSRLSHMTLFHLVNFRISRLYVVN